MESRKHINQPDIAFTKHNIRHFAYPTKVEPRILFDPGSLEITCFFTKDNPVIHQLCQIPSNRSAEQTQTWMQDYSFPFRHGTVYYVQSPQVRMGEQVNSFIPRSFKFFFLLMDPSVDISFHLRQFKLNADQFALFNLSADVQEV